MKNYGRKLAPVEEEFELYQNQLEGTASIAALMRVRGAINIHVIKQSLSLIQQRHPFLQMHIVDSKDGMYFEAEQAPEIPLRIVERNQEKQWLEVIEEGFSQKFDSQRDLLLKVAYIPSGFGSDIFDLIFTIHHSISDGVSLIELCREFLDYCARIAAGEQVEVEKLSLSPPIEALFPKSITALPLRIFLFQLKFLLTQLLKKPCQFEHNVDYSLSETKCRLIHRFLNEEKTEQLCKLCKKEGTTVTGALNAAMLLACKNELAIAGDFYLNATIAVDIRKFLRSEFAHQQNLGFMASSFFITEQISNNSSFWELARNSRQKIEQYLRNYQYYYLRLAAQSRIDSFKKGQFFPLSYGLSNMGQINQVSKYGSLELVENHITACNRNPFQPYLILHCTTFRSKMYLTLSYTEPLFSIKKAQSLMDCLMSSIDEAMGNHY
ncbi:MAG: hypothetical protein F6J96_09730 [Symploca sp. SIO1C2]|nr:hypothetical protein [Symploca sp. SIO1C2]